LADTIQLQKNTVPEPGPFCDWDGRVFSDDGGVFRALTLGERRTFVALLESRFSVPESVKLPSGTRTLYLVEPR
jgi:hypothetical protein